MKSNKSRTYLLPLLSELVNFEMKFDKFIINTYIHFNVEKYKNCIGILHNFSFRNPDFTAYEHKLINNELFVDIVDIDDNVLYIFKFPEEYIHEYNSFINGKYSAFGLDAKELILNYYNQLYKGNLNATAFLLKVNHVLFKDKKLKKQIEKDLGVVLDEDAELSDIPSRQDETYFIDKKYIKDINTIIHNEEDRNCLKNKNEDE